MYSFISALWFNLFCSWFNFFMYLIWQVNGVTTKGICPYFFFQWLQPTVYKHVWMFFCCLYVICTVLGLSTPLCLQILTIGREGMIDDVITHGTWRHLYKKYLLTLIVPNLRWLSQNAWKRCCWHCNIWPDWFTSHQSHY